MRASNKAGKSANSAVWEFATKTPLSIPVAPVLVRPLYPNILFPWKPVNLADRYQIQISNYSNFSQAIVYDNNQVSNTSLSNMDLEPDEIYFWKVRAINVSGTGPFSPVWNFKTEALPPLENPELFSPGNGVRNNSSTVKLMWGPVTEADIYQLEISKDRTFKINPIKIGQIQVLQWVLNGLEMGETYYWKITAIGKRPSSTSATWHFTIPEDDPLHKIKLTSIKEYPNPFSDQLHLKFLTPPQEEFQITVLNSLGVSVFESPLKNAQEIVTLQLPHGLAKGVYLLKIQGFGFLEVIRIVKE